MTVEREGVLSSFVVGLSGTDPVIEVPMPADYAPDVYVSVLAVRGRISDWSAWGADVARSWGLPFSKDGGKPTATVDLAKPSYRLGIAKVKVGWEGHTLGVAVKADKARYGARDTATVDVEVKNPDGKPAASADVAFAAVDEALLQLAPNDSWDVLTAMMGERPLSVLTSTAQMQVVGKRHYGRKAVEAGGGGGNGDLSGLNRENFQPVLLWKGKLDLDSNGHAQVKVPLSDALTSFKLVAIATSGTDLFGTGSASVRTAQDLSIFSGGAAAGAHRRPFQRGVHAAQRIGQADARHRDRRAQPGDRDREPADGRRAGRGRRPRRVEPHRAAGRRQAHLDRLGQIGRRQGERPGDGHAGHHPRGPGRDLGGDARAGRRPAPASRSARPRARCPGAARSTCCSPTRSRRRSRACAIT